MILDLVELQAHVSQQQLVSQRLSANSLSATTKLSSCPLSARSSANALNCRRMFLINYPSQAGKYFGKSSKWDYDPGENEGMSYSQNRF